MAVELKDLSGSESAGWHSSNNTQPATAPSIGEARRGDGAQARLMSDQDDVRCESESSQPSESPTQTGPECNDDDLEQDEIRAGENNNQLKSSRCKFLSASRVECGAKEMDRPEQEHDQKQSIKLNPAEGSPRMRPKSARVNNKSDASQQEADKQQNRTTDMERRLRPQKYCSVCGDKAIACNFNAVTCESCKAFFRRNAFKEQRLRCLFENRCVIDRVTRRFCSKCRLLKCLAIGMKREWILTEEQKQIKRVKIMQNKQTRHQQQVSTTNQSNGNSSGSDEATESSGRLELVHSSETYQTKEPQDSDHSSRRQVETRDASVSCPDDGAFPLVQCSFASQCQFCSLRLGGGGGDAGSGQPAASLDPFRAQNHNHNHHHHPMGHHQVVVNHFQPLHGGQSQRHAHYHYPQHVPALVYNQQPQPQAQSWPHLASMAATSSPAAACCQVDQMGVTVQRGTEMVPNHHHHHHHHHQNHYNATGCAGVIVSGGSQPGLQVVAAQAAGGECCCPGGKMMRATTCNVEPATSTTSSNANQLAGGGAAGQEIATTSGVPPPPPHLHELNPSRNKPTGLACSADFGQARAGCGGGPEWGPSASEPAGEEAASSKLTGGATQVAADCQEKLYQHGQEYISNECDTAPDVSQQLAASGATPIESSCVYSEAPNSASGLIEWRGELFVKPAFSEQETWDRISRLELSHTERQLILEMEAATRQILDVVEKPSNDSALDDIIFFLDVALKSLIKSVKKISAFRMLSMDDQIVLLKNACFKILLVRSCLYYNDQIEGWMDRFGHVKYLRVLKNDMCNSYERHKELLEKLARPLRRDRPIIMFLIMVVLFDPTTPGLKSASSIELDNLVYLSVLRKYLLATQPEPLAKYERLVEALRVMNVCNEEYNLFFSRKYQPEQITPLLIEIFDISVNSPTQ